MKDVLFVTYGSGHVRMVLPVAQALASSGLGRPLVLGLTTAAPLVKEAGLELLQFKDFLLPGDDKALAHGRRLLGQMRGPVADEQESIAYLGLCYSELEQDVGVCEASQRYARYGRQAFLPLRILQRVLSRISPSLVVATNSPRAERAAIEGARALGIPSVCMVDLFCLDEVGWIGQPDYGDRVCVLNDSVKEFLVHAGRDDAQVVVTGNPAFDDLANPLYVAKGVFLREINHWNGKHVLLWPTQVEPAFHPFNGKPGHPDLPHRALSAVVEWVLSRQDCVLCVRPRAGELAPPLPADARIRIVGQETGLASLLHAVDIVVTLNSTVGLEGHLAGKRLIQVLGSVFDDAMPLKKYGIADEAVAVESISQALERCVGRPVAATARSRTAAAPKVLEVLRAFL